MLERTLVVLKPDAVERGIVGEIITRFERVGIKIVGAKMFIPSTELMEQHYPSDRKEFIEGMGQKTLDNYKASGKDAKEMLGTDDAHEIGLVIQKWLRDYMSAGPVLAMVLEGPHVIELVRKLRGHTLPIMAAPGTISGDYSFDSSALANEAMRPIKNLVHASGNAEEAAFEIGLWFKDDELFDYEGLHQKSMRS